VKRKFTVGEIQLNNGKGTQRLRLEIRYLSEGGGEVVHEKLRVVKSREPLKYSVLGVTFSVKGTSQGSEQ